MSEFEDDEDLSILDGQGNETQRKPNSAQGNETSAQASAEGPCTKKGEETLEPPEAKQEEDEEEDIYADIVAPVPSKPFQEEHSAATVPAPAPAPASPEAQKDWQLAIVERQNSGSFAGSSATAPSKPPLAKPQRKGVLPKILADTTICYIGELEWWTNDVELETICAEFGIVDSLTFFEDKASGKSKGYCLVKFTTKEAANLCRHQMHGMVINGRKCVVTFSNNKNASSKNSRQQTNPNTGTAPRGPQYNPQMEHGHGGDFPPLPPWGMTSLPMPGGLAMPPFMDLGNQAMEPDYKRRRY